MSLFIPSKDEILAHKMPTFLHEKKKTGWHQWANFPCGRPHEADPLRFDVTNGWLLTTVPHQKHVQHYQTECVQAVVIIISEYSNSDPLKNHSKDTSLFTSPAPTPKTENIRSMRSAERTYRWSYCCRTRHNAPRIVWLSRWRWNKDKWRSVNKQLKVHLHLATSTRALWIFSILWIIYQMLMDLREGNPLG